MYKQLKNDGFTLIEVIVSIAISSIALGIALSIIVTSFNMFGNVSETGARKNELDNIVDYVNDQLRYAGKIVITDPNDGTAPKDDGWKWLYIKNGMLYAGQRGQTVDKNVLGKSFYNVKENSSDKDDDDTRSSRSLTLSMDVTISKIYDNDKRDNNTGYRGVFNYSIKNGYNSSSDHYTEYKKKDTLKFSNITGTIDRPESESTTYYLGDIQNTSDEKNIIGNKQNISTKYIYYKESKSTVVKKKLKYNGTVEDRISSMTYYLNRGYFTTTPSNKGYDNLYNNMPTFYNTVNNHFYRVGDYVYYQGYWWQLIKELPNTGNVPGGGVKCWEKLDQNYDSTSGYVKGDVVKYNNRYYRFKDTDYPWDTPHENSQQWEDVTDNQPDVGFDPNLYLYSANKTLYDILIDNDKLPGSPVNDSARTTIKDEEASTIHYKGVDEYSASNIQQFLDKENSSNKNERYKINDVVQIKVTNSGKPDGTDSYYRLYKKISEPANFATDIMKIPGNSCFSGWECLDANYYPGSAYPDGAVLRYSDLSQKVVSANNSLPNTEEFIVARTNSNTTINPQLADISVNLGIGYDRDGNKITIPKSKPKFEYGFDYNGEWHTLDDNANCYCWDNYKWRKVATREVTQNDGSITTEVGYYYTIIFGSHWKKISNPELYNIYYYDQFDNSHKVMIEKRTVSSVEAYCLSKLKSADPTNTNDLKSLDTIGSTNSALYAISKMSLWYSDESVADKNSSSVFKAILEKDGNSYNIEDLGFGGWNNDTDFSVSRPDYFPSRVGNIDNGHKELLALHSALIYNCNLSDVDTSYTDVIRKCENSFWVKKSPKELGIVE